MPIVLRICYAVSGTDLRYAATSLGLAHGMPVSHVAMAYAPRDRAAKSIANHRLCGTKRNGPAVSWN
eukprot:3922535-Rhodomonas_salina.4